MYLTSLRRASRRGKTLGYAWNGIIYRLRLQSVKYEKWNFIKEVPASCLSALAKAAI